jgi:hypothetical protein
MAEVAYSSINEGYDDTLDCLADSSCVPHGVVVSGGFLDAELAATKERVGGLVP